MTAKQLRPQSVSRVLARSGFGRAESETTSVRGYRRYTPGFEVRGAKAAWEFGLTSDPAEDAVYVEVQTINSFDYGTERRPHDDVIAEMVPGYEQALTGAGFDVQRIERNGRFRALRVTSR